MKEMHGSVPDVLVAKLVEMTSQYPAAQAIALLYFILLGRAPDADGAAFYTKRFATSADEKRAVVTELASSDEAEMFGALYFPRECLDLGNGIGSVVTEPAATLALLGATRRRLIEAMERLRNIEDLVKLRLLSVPEISGASFDALSQRVLALEQNLKR